MSELNKKQVELSFRRYHDCADAVLRSDHNRFRNNLAIFMHFLETDQIMQLVTPQLQRADVNFDEWWTQTQNQRQGMVGSGRFDLPLDEAPRTALLYQFCRKVNDGTIGVENFALRFLARHRGDNLHDMVSAFNDAIVEPFVRALQYKFDEIQFTIEESVTGMQPVPLQLFVIYQDNSTNIGNENQFEGDATIGRGASLDKTK